MKTSAAKSKENQNQSIADHVAQNSRSERSGSQVSAISAEEIIPDKMSGSIDNKPQTHQLKSYRDMIADSPQTKYLSQLQSMADQSRQNPETVVQRAWDGDERSEVRNWDEILAPGLQWHWNNASKKLYFTIPGEESEGDSADIKRLRKRQREEHPYEDWLRAGWPGLGKIPVVSLSSAQPNSWESQAANFIKFMGIGRTKYSLLSKPVERLSENTKKDREDFFRDNYETKVHGVREDQPYAPYNYKSVLKGSKYHQSNGAQKEGHYINESNLAFGTLTADQNYADNEKYMDRDKGESRYSNSEVLYQQWKKAKSSLPKSGEGAELAEAKLSTLRRAHVAGDGIPVVEAVHAWLLRRDSKYNKNKHDVTLTPADDAFYALLASANCQAAIFLIRDHGDDLGIRDIREIRLMGGSSIEIDFLEG